MMGHGLLCGVHIWSDLRDKKKKRKKISSSNPNLVWWNSWIRVDRELTLSAMETDSNAPPPPAPAPAGAGEGSSSAAGPSSRKPNKRFEIKKWNAVALWAWGTLRASFLLYSPLTLIILTIFWVLIWSLFLLLRYRRRQLRHLPQPHHGSMSVRPPFSSLVLFISPSFCYLLLRAIWILICFLGCRHRVPGEPGQRHQWGVHCRLGYASIHFYQPITPCFNCRMLNFSLDWLTIQEANLHVYITPPFAMTNVLIIPFIYI